MAYSKGLHVHHGGVLCSRAIGRVSGHDKPSGVLFPHSPSLSEVDAQMICINDNDEWDV
jgi:hypothetical protein